MLSEIFTTAGGPSPVSLKLRGDAASTSKEFIGFKNA
jgi:hypothetical protein